ncbi:MAB_1171c family putative transporter [Streptomyces tsukubensis]|uniref:MAB_1171c family putative transporter n=1 Tax=Streptomyces tsukubensis TaxID=83656 RepID=UPI00367D2929
MVIIFLLSLGAAVAWKAYQLSRGPYDRSLRAITACLLSAAASYPFAMPGGASGFDGIAGHGMAKLMQNLLLLATVYFLMLFYLYSAADKADGRQRAKREAVVVLAVAATMTVAAKTVDHTALAGSFSTLDMTIPQVAVFYLVGGLYLAYALAVAGVWTRRYARVSERPHSTGLWMAAIGMFGMSVSSLTRMGFVAVRSQGGHVPMDLMNVVARALMVSIFLFFIGVTYPGVRTRVSACRIWIVQRRAYRRLEPLWRLITDALPHVVLDIEAPTRSERLGLRGVRRRYYRRVVECRDGLVLLAPYLTPEGAADAPDPVVKQAAAVLREAVAAQGGDAGALSLEIVRERDRTADRGQLCSLSDAVRKVPRMHWEVVEHVGQR